MEHDIYAAKKCIRNLVNDATRFVAEIPTNWRRRWILHQKFSRMWAAKKKEARFTVTPMGNTKDGHQSTGR